jgi:hypothetical protein
MNARDRYVELAVAAEGLSYAPATRERYLDLVVTSALDRANPQRCAELGADSGCALVVRGLLKLWGVTHEILFAPYRTGRAVSDVVEIAREAGALRLPDHRPDLADVVIIEQPEHVLSTVGWKYGILCSVDGGQRDELHFETIQRKERGYDLPARRLGGRPILNVIDLGVLAARYGIGSDDAPDTEPATPQ